MTTFYTLSLEVNPDDFRYIGQTILSLEDRLAIHFSHARQRYASYADDGGLGGFIRGALTAGHRVLIQEYTDGGVPFESEADAVAHARAQGCDLLNTATPGSGRTAVPLPDVAAALLGRVPDRWIAEAFEVDPSKVRRRRRALGIAPYACRTLTLEEREVARRRLLSAMEMEGTDTVQDDLAPETVAAARSPLVTMDEITSGPGTVGGRA